MVLGLIFLLLVAAGTLSFTKRAKLPLTVTLLVVGMGLSALIRAYPDCFGMLGTLEISHDLILFIFLPTLIFESTFNMNVQAFRENLGPILLLAIPGVLISTAIIGVSISFLTHLPIEAALILGAILSATDPVAVISLFRQLGAPQRLIVLVEGESLLNDATAIVLTKILIGVFVASSFSMQTLESGILDFLLLFVGGTICGTVLGWVAGILLGMVESDFLVETSITTAAAYLSFLLAEQVFGVSGVMATVGTGLVLGGWGRVKISAPVRDYLEHFWEYMAFLANAFIFLLVGMRVSLPDLWQSLDVVALVLIVMLFARAVVVYGLLPLLNRLPRAEEINRRYQTVMWWGGLRGAIALAIVLSLDSFAYSSLFTAIVMGVVLFTLLVQGFSMRSLVKKLGLDTPPLMDVQSQLECRLSAKIRALELVPKLQTGGQFSHVIAESIRFEIQDDVQSLQEEMNLLREKEITREKEYAMLFLRAFAEERACYAELFSLGHISEQTYRQLLLTISAQTEALRQEGHYVSIQTHRFRRKLEPHIHAFLKRYSQLAFLSEYWRLKRFLIDYENDWAHHQGTSRVLERIQQLAVLESISPDIAKEAECHYQQWQARAEERLKNAVAQSPEFVAVLQERLARRMVLLTGIKSAEEYADRGILPHAMAKKIQQDLREQVRALRTLRYGQFTIEPEELLSKLPFLQNVSRSVIDQMSVQLVAHQFQAKEVLVNKGEVGEGVYLVASGVLHCSAENDDSARNVLTAGDAYGENHLFGDEVFKEAISCVTSGVCYILTPKLLTHWMQNYPEVAQSVAAYQAEKGHS